MWFLPIPRLLRYEFHSASDFNNSFGYACSLYSGGLPFELLYSRSNDNSPIKWNCCRWSLLFLLFHLYILNCCFWYYLLFFSDYLVNRTILVKKTAASQKRFVFSFQFKRLPFNRTGRVWAIFVFCFWLSRLELDNI